MSKTNQQQMFDVISQWQQSGLSQKAWCEQKGIAYSSFHYWYKRYRNQHIGRQDTDTFIQLATPSFTPWCELVMSNGTKVFFHQPVSAEFIRRFID